VDFVILRMKALRNFETPGAGEILPTQRSILEDLHLHCISAVNEIIKTVVHCVKDFAVPYDVPV